MFKIQFLSGSLQGKRFELSKDQIILGRLDTSDVQIDDGSVSSQHAELNLIQGRWQLKDLGSSNGLSVNEKPFTNGWISPGDLVGIGNNSFILQADENPEQDAEISASSEDLALVHQMRERTDRIRLEVGKIIVGQRDVLDQVLMCIIAGGHALLIGLPGMAKTLLVRTISQVLNLDYKRVQFTPDLMPSDIIGTDVLDTDLATGNKKFRFIQGPIFCNLLLADEINRTPPKTQAALLEAMQEKMVTAGNKSYTLDAPFFVLAR